MFLTLLIILGAVVMGWLSSLLIHLQSTGLNAYRIPIISQEVDLTLPRIEWAPSEAIAESMAREFAENAVGWRPDSYTQGDIERIG